MRAVSLFVCCCAPVARKTPFACWRSRTPSTRTTRRRSSASRSCSHSRTAFARPSRCWLKAINDSPNARRRRRRSPGCLPRRRICPSAMASERSISPMPCTALNRRRCMARRSRSRSRSSNVVTEALSWMKRAVAEAEQENDAAEATRLRGEMAKYRTRRVVRQWQ